MTFCILRVILTRSSTVDFFVWLFNIGVKLVPLILQILAQCGSIKLRWRLLKKGTLTLFPCKINTLPAVWSGDPYPLVFTVVPGDGTVGSLSLNGLTIRTHQDWCHETQRSKTWTKHKTNKSLKRATHDQHKPKQSNTLYYNHFLVLSLWWEHAVKVSYPEPECLTAHLHRNSCRPKQIRLKT